MFAGDVCNNFECRDNVIVELLSSVSVYQCMWVCTSLDDRDRHTHACDAAREMREKETRSVISKMPLQVC